MKKRNHSPDNTIAYIVAALAIVMVSATLVWASMGFPRPGTQTDNSVTVGPFDFKVQDQSARITLNLQSAADNKRWTQEHQGALEQVINRVLAKTDPAVMNASNDVKFAKMQDLLQVEINKNFPEAKIDKIFITDFVSAQN